MDISIKKSWTTAALLQSFWFIAAFSFISGYINAYSYIVRGGVFANNQTGNAAMFGVAMFMRDTPHMLDALWPMLATIAGAFIAEHLRRVSKDKAEGIWQMRALYIEIPAFIMIGLVPLTVPNAIPNVTLSMIAGFQLSAFRTFDGWVFNSTIQTGDLRTMGQYIYQAIFIEKKKAFSKKTFAFFILLVLFSLGCAVGAYFSSILGIRGIWGGIPILAVLAIAHRRLVAVGS